MNLGTWTCPSIEYVDLQIEHHYDLLILFGFFLKVCYYSVLKLRISYHEQIIRMETHNATWLVSRGIVT